MTLVCSINNRTIIAHPLECCIVRRRFHTRMNCNRGRPQGAITPWPLKSNSRYLLHRGLREQGAERAKSPSDGNKKCRQDYLDFAAARAACEQNGCPNCRRIAATSPAWDASGFWRPNMIVMRRQTLIVPTAVTIHRQARRKDVISNIFVPRSSLAHIRRSARGWQRHPEECNAGEDDFICAMR